MGGSTRAPPRIAGSRPPPRRVARLPLIFQGRRTALHASCAASLPLGERGIRSLVKPVRPGLRGVVEAPAWPLSAELKHLRHRSAPELCAGSGHSVPKLERRARHSPRTRLLPGPPSPVRPDHRAGARPEVGASALLGHLRAAALSEKAAQGGWGNRSELGPWDPEAGEINLKESGLAERSRLRCFSNCPLRNRALNCHWCLRARRRLGFR